MERRPRSTIIIIITIIIMFIVIVIIIIISIIIIIIIIVIIHKHVAGTLGSKPTDQPNLLLFNPPVRRPLSMLYM